MGQSPASVKSCRCRLAIRRRELNRALRICWKSRGRRSAQQRLFGRKERDALGLSSHGENGDALEARRINRLVVFTDEEDFNRLVFGDEFEPASAIRPPC
jgi:hypothetical protein